MKPILLISLLFCLFTADTAKGQERPNIIFILADDLGYGEIEPYGQKEIQTPSLSKFAKEGMVFTRHYAGTAVCAPSRCVLMTGLHTGHCQIRGNQQARPHGQVPLKAATLTVAEVLKKAGYTTGMIGKWGLGETGTEGDPNTQGFDFFYGYTDQILAHNHFPEFLVRNGKVEHLKNKVRYLDSAAWHKGRGSYTTEKKEFADELFTREAIRFISANKAKPFFLYLPYVIPHNNGEAPVEDQYEAPGHLQYRNRDWKKKEKDYAASITYLDQYVGRIADHLRKLRIDKNTLIIFTSDNGHEQEDLRFESAAGLRGRKRDLYEGGIRVPFIAWWPGKVKAGSATDHISGFWDVMPTVAELAGAKEVPANDGISFVPALLGAKQKVHEFVYFEFHEQGGKQALIKDEWKIVALNVKTGTPRFELYNLSSDPSEKNDVAAKNPEIVSALQELINRAHTPSESFPFPHDKLR